MSTADALYQQVIKDWAQADHGHGRLAAADAEARLDNPLCGDRVRVQVSLGGGRIEAIAHETRGCLLCRAAASLLGARAAGLDGAAIDELVRALESLLREQTPAPEDWPELGMFQPVHAFASRHKCALLPFKALQAAMRSAAGAP
jgi:SUF system NifU family Fe-S assembly protein